MCATFTNYALWNGDIFICTYLLLELFQGRNLKKCKTKSQTGNKTTRKMSTLTGVIKALLITLWNGDIFFFTYLLLELFQGWNLKKCKTKSQTGNKTTRKMSRSTGVIKSLLITLWNGDIFFFTYLLLELFQGQNFF